MTRPTPFDLVFADVAADTFSAIHDEIGGSTTPLGRGGFANLPSVQRLLADAGSTDGSGADAEMISAYLDALFVAYRFWEAERPVRVVARQALEPLLDAPPSGLHPAIPAACYLQFPERWFWARIEEHAPYEPLDGIFVVSGAPREGVIVLGVLGLRAERGGFSQVTVSATRDDWAAVQALLRRPPFAPTVEGGAQAGLRTLASHAELAYLAQLALEVTGQ